MFVKSIIISNHRVFVQSDKKLRSNPLNLSLQSFLVFFNIFGILLQLKTKVLLRAQKFRHYELQILGWFTTVFNRLKVRFLRFKYLYFVLFPHLQNEKCTALHFAATQGATEIVKLMMSSYAGEESIIDAVDGNKETLLHRQEAAVPDFTVNCETWYSQLFLVFGTPK